MEKSILFSSAFTENSTIKHKVRSSPEGGLRHPSGTVSRQEGFVSEGRRTGAKGVLNKQPAEFPPAHSSLSSDPQLLHQPAWERSARVRGGDGSITETVKVPESWTQPASEGLPGPTESLSAPSPSFCSGEHVFFTCSPAHFHCRPNNTVSA
ncbi:hypothetical protein AOLI_G00314280 [Acnodon oligacanthus]